VQALSAMAMLPIFGPIRWARELYKQKFNFDDPPSAETRTEPTDADAAQSSKDKAGSRKNMSSNYSKYTQRTCGARCRRRRITMHHWGARK